jgi:hypothetical protein
VETSAQVVALRVTDRYVTCMTMHAHTLLRGSQPLQLRTLPNPARTLHFISCTPPSRPVMFRKRSGGPPLLRAHELVSSLHDQAHAIRSIRCIFSHACGLHAFDHHSSRADMDTDDVTTMHLCAYACVGSLTA